MKIKVSVLLLALLSGCDNTPAPEKGFAGLGHQAEAFTPVVPGRVFSFPADHGPHDGFRIEWWYVTANLKDDQGHEFGAQWTLFRSALKATPEQSGWSNQTIWLGHAAVTSATVHHAAERYARGGVGQAGVSLAPLRKDWTMASTVIGLFSARRETRSNPRPSSIELRTVHVRGEPEGHSLVEVALEAGHGAGREPKHQVLAQIAPADRLS